MTTATHALREQEALRRIAILVAQETSQAQVFEAIASEAMQLLRTDAVRIVRYDGDSGVVLAGSGQPEVTPPGFRFPLDGNTVAARIFRQGKPARQDEYNELSGSLPESIRAAGIRSVVGAPVLVEGRLWGAITTGMTREEPLPPDAESRLGEFTALMATAISNAEARAEVQQLAEEQAALWRVAKLVAEAVPPAEIFSAVSNEVATLFRAELVVVGKFDGDPAALLVVGVGDAADEPVVGSRWKLDDVLASTAVYRTGHPARFDHDSPIADPDVAAIVDRFRPTATVAVPIKVESRLWGAMIVSTRHAPLPTDTEQRLQRFTDLIATTLANAEARAEMHRLADEQSALRRVAVLVAQQPSPSEVFTAVTQAVGMVLGADLAGLNVFEGDGTTTIAGWSGDGGPIPPIGSRFSVHGDSVVARIFETHAPARIDSYAEAEGEAADVARNLRLRSTVGAPILVEGKLWGALVAGTRGVEPWAENAETRIAAFTELVATAIANAESREALAELVEEQAALRRVAVLVAENPESSEVFSAVAREVADVLDVRGVIVDRFEDDGSQVTLGSAYDFELEGADAFLGVGVRLPLHPGTLSARVLETQGAARVDDYSKLDGEMGDAARAAGVGSGCGAPIFVDGRLWGQICVFSEAGSSLPPGMEQKLDDFAKLVATAISNYDARSRLRTLAAEQAALRRVATLVAQGVKRAKLFSSVTKEVARVFSDVDPELVASVIRFDPGPESVLVGASREYEQEALASRWAPKELYVSTHVLRTGSSARVNEADLDATGGPDADVLRLRRFFYQVGSPVVVEGQLWGAMCLNSTRELPPDTEERLEKFTDLVATAIANAESREARAVLTEEQAALRRVATLVASGASPERVFQAVAVEVTELFSSDQSAILRFEGGRTATVLGAVAAAHEVGKPLTLSRGYVVDVVRETGRSARFDTDDPSATDMPWFVQQQGIRSGVASPIVVEGELWGALTTASLDGPLPHGAERRITEFTELVATAVANTQAREEVTLLADEQAALRRVATLVARGAPSDEVFEAVAAEVGSLFDTDITIVGRYDDDGMATAIGNWSSSSGGVPVGTRSSLGGRNLLTMVAETGEPARIDGYEDATGESAEIARRHGWRSSIAAPIVVEDRLWGVMLVATGRPEPFPAGAEKRLAAFTDLVATAVGNAQAHDEVRRFGAEQAALRRVATLVAGGTGPDQLFAAVAGEVEELLGSEASAIVKFEDDGTVVTVGTHRGPRAVGTRSEPDPDFVVAAVRRTRRAARFDTDDPTAADTPAIAREAGIRSAVASPIVVEGEFWGAMVVGSVNRSLPAETERRLADFTNLVATAVANSEARQALERVAAEQATLRGIATLVAEGLQPGEVFAAVVEEVGRLFKTELTIVGRFQDDPPVFVAAAIGSGMRGVEVGSQWKLDDPLAATHVFGSGRSVRANENLRERSAALAETLADLGVVSTVASPVMVEGRLWGAVIVSSQEELPGNTEERLDRFTELIATAVANAESKSALAASRRRIVTASDDTRRQIERDLHDGTQQRLVSLGLALRAAEAAVPPDRPDLQADLSQIATGLAGAVEDLQELSRGIHPAILSRGGLVPALRTLARRSAIPVELDVSTEISIPQPIEVAAYFVASEALANATKHAQASRIEMTLASNEGHLLLTLRDDGVGGADPAHGTGLVGLTDRVEALGGSIDIESPTGDGTQIAVRLPLELESVDPEESF